MFVTASRTDWGPLALELPDPTSVKPLPLAIAVLAAVLLCRGKWSVLRTLASAHWSASSPALSGSR